MLQCVVANPPCSADEAQKAVSALELVQFDHLAIGFKRKALRSASATALPLALWVDLRI